VLEQGWWSEEARESFLPRMLRGVIAHVPSSSIHSFGRTPMTNLARHVKRFLVSEDGPTAVEYAVMLALIIIVCLTAISAIGTNASTTFNNVAQSIGSS
jgi:pilus assembly protein Flp/PilA